jgi:3',5'-cyclic AMP phosphodiesterase CpdA
VNRRQWLQSFGATALLSTRAASLAFAEPPTAQGFSFIFFTDTHIQPELKAAEGCRTCFKQLESVPGDFAICGGDLVFDALAVPAARAVALYDLFRQTSAALRVPVHYTLGNHDVFGLTPKSGVATSDPQYGKKAFEDRYGPTRYSFDHKGWHFIVLDSIAPLPDRTWIGRVGQEQIAWLRDDLAKTGKTTPIVVVTHVPLVTGAVSYVPRADWLSKTPSLAGLLDTLMVTDAAEVIDALLPYNIRVVLQGHTHVNEDITFRGLRFITSGAVSGNWWKGVRAGSPEGYSTLRLGIDGSVQHSYHAYGFQAVT